MRSTPAVFSENRYLDGSDIGDRQEADCRFRELQQIEWRFLADTVEKLVAEAAVVVASLSMRSS
jgi:hypothetical protein